MLDIPSSHTQIPLGRDMRRIFCMVSSPRLVSPDVQETFGGRMYLGLCMCDNGFVRVHSQERMYCIYTWQSTTNVYMSD